MSINSLITVDNTRNRYLLLLSAIRRVIPNLPSNPWMETLKYSYGLLPDMYIKLGHRVKTPVEKWRQYQYTKEELAPWIADGGNIGFACGQDDVVVLDIDDIPRCAELDIKPFETYTVKTGSGGLHFYYRIPECQTRRLFDIADKSVHLADLQCLGTYVVCPPSVHPNGVPYKVVDTSEISNLNWEELWSILEGKVYIPEPASTELRCGITRPQAFNIDDVWSVSGFQPVGSQVSGPHPVHGSRTGKNLVVNLKKGTWWCGRCNSGGGAVEALAVDMGLIRCDEARRGCLRGEKWHKVCEEAVRRRLV